MKKGKKIVESLKENEKVKRITQWMQKSADRELFKVASIAVFVIFNTEVLFLLLGIVTGEYILFYTMGGVIVALLLILIVSFLSVFLAKKVEDFIFK